MGKIVTYLEMLSFDDLKPSREAPELTLRRAEGPTPEVAEAHVRVGADYGWKSATRTAEGWADLVEGRPDRQFWLIEAAGVKIGIVTIEPQNDGEVEIVTFGLLPEHVGKGLGGPALTLALRQAWATTWLSGQDVRRVWLHTNDHDHPNALRNYRARGLTVYKTETETET